MFTCKDCVHYEVCGFTSITSKSVEKDCRDFKNKADFVEVKHGRWIVTEDDYGICATEFTCPLCKVSLVTSELTDGQFLDMMKYCPNCGADMRKEGAENG